MSLLMLTHLVSGAVAILAGSIALVTPRNGAVHSRTGIAFFILVMSCSLTGVIITLLRTNLFVALVCGLLGYLAITSRRAVQYRDREGPDPTQFALMLFAFGIVTASVMLGTEAAQSTDGPKPGFPAEAYWGLALFSLFTSALDASLIIRPRMSGNQPLNRHLWRMLAGVLICGWILLAGPGATALVEAVRKAGILSSTAHLDPETFSFLEL